MSDDDNCPSPGKSPQFHQFQHQTPFSGGDMGSPVRYIGDMVLVLVLMEDKDGWK